MRIDFTNPGAFAPFYDQSVAVKGGVQSGTFRACVFEEGLDDPLADATIETDRRRLSVHIPKTGTGGWNHTTPPKVGDILTVLSWGGIEGADDFAAASVADFGDAWVIDAREVQR